MFFRIKELFAPKEPLVELTVQLIRTLGVRVTDETIKEAIEDHPDQGSLLSISDVLNTYNVENVVAKVAKPDVMKLNTPFIAQLNSKEGLPYFTVVKAINEVKVICWNGLKSKWIAYERAEFTADFLGTVLLADVDETSGDIDYDQKYQHQLRKKTIKVISEIGLLVLIGAVILNIRSMSMILSFANVLLYGLGTSIAFLLLYYEIDQQNGLIKQLCGKTGKRDCAAVTSSKASHIVGISWSSIGFSYFFGGLLALLTGGITNVPMLILLSAMSMFSLPYIVFSVYYQWQVARQWCVLCLAIQAVLFTLAALSIISSSFSFNDLKNIPVTTFLMLMICYLIPFIAVNHLMPILHKIKNAKRQKSELMRLKHDPEIFNTLLRNQKSIEYDVTGLGLLLGNSEGTTRIIKVCNPYCGPCAYAQPAIDALVSNNPDVCVQIIFTASDSEHDIGAAPVKHLMAIAEQNSEELLKSALDDWYNATEKNYELFALKYAHVEGVNDQGQKLKAMNEWCNKTQIAFTPTFFINGRQLPQMYSVNDLKYFFSS